VTLEEVVIGIARIAGSLFVLRWAFAGAILAMVVDLSDLFMMNLLHLGGVRNYQVLDKWLDQVYMACFLIVALRWRGPQRTIAVALYALRLIGFAAFDLTGSRAVLVFFPNVFEFWFVFVASLPHWRPEFAFSRRNVALVLAPLLAAKEAQELIIHWFKLLDSFTAVEAVEAIWDFVAGPFR